VTKTREQLATEIAATLDGEPDYDGFKDQFVEATITLIELGLATWDGENLILVQGGKQ